MAGQVASRVSQILPALLALAVPAVLEAQITLSPQGVPPSPPTVSVQINPGSMPGTYIVKVTYNVSSLCTGDMATVWGATNASGNPIGTTSFFSATPVAPNGVTSLSNGFVMLDYRNAIPNGLVGLGGVTLPTGTTGANFVVGISGSSPSCSNPTESFPIVASTGAPNLTITKSAYGAQGDIPDMGPVYNGQEIAFRVVVKNEGTAPTSGATTITDRISQYLDVKRVQKFSQFDGSVSDCPLPVFGLVTCTTFKISPGDVAIVIITAVVNSQVPVAIPNTATVTGGGDPATPKSATLTVFDNGMKAPFTCGDSDTEFCLFKTGSSVTAPGPAPLAVSAAGRFQVRVYWNAVRQGTSGPGHAVPLTSDTGYFWFFSPNNIELVIKVVDGRPVNGKFWVFYGALSNVAYIIEVVDSMTGAIQGYFNPQDNQASNADTSAFGAATTVGTESEFQFIPMNTSDPAPGHPRMPSLEPVATAATAACVADALTQCLNGGRFQVRVHWQALHLGASGEGEAVPITSDTGYFWFFSANNIELVIKVVDGRPVNSKFWVFYGALTNVQYTITITDTVTGAVKMYFNPQDTQASASDTSAF